MSVHEMCRLSFAGVKYETSKTEMKLEEAPSSVYEISSVAGFDVVGLCLRLNLFIFSNNEIGRICGRCSEGDAILRKTTRHHALEVGALSIKLACQMNGQTWWLLFGVPCGLYHQTSNSLDKFVTLVGGSWPTLWTISTLSYLSLNVLF